MPPRTASVLLQLADRVFLQQIVSTDHRSHPHVHTQTFISDCFVKGAFGLLSCCCLFASTICRHCLPICIRRCRRRLRQCELHNQQLFSIDHLYLTDCIRMMNFERNVFYSESIHVYASCMRVYLYMYMSVPPGVRRRALSMVIPRRCAWNLPKRGTTRP